MRFLLPLYSFVDIFNHPVLDYFAFLNEISRQEIKLFFFFFKNQPNFVFIVVNNLRFVSSLWVKNSFPVLVTTQYVFHFLQLYKKHFWDLGDHVKIQFRAC